MIDIKKSGYIVETKQGVGRTIHKNGLINGKIPVYLATKMDDQGLGIPLSFSTEAILCDPKSLKQIGFID